jgi:hypothetical protein
MIKRDEIRYQWQGDGVLATMHLTSSDDSRGIPYKFFMEFDDIAIKEQSDAIFRSTGPTRSWRT